MEANLLTDNRFLGGRGSLAPLVRMMGELLTDPLDIFATAYGRKVLASNRNLVENGLEPCCKNALESHIRYRIALVSDIRDNGYDPAKATAPIRAKLRGGVINISDGSHRTSTLLYLERPIWVDLVHDQTLAR